MNVNLQKLQKVKDDESNNLIKRFSLQILQEKFIFTANGFFTLNFEFIGSVSYVFLSTIKTSYSHKMCSQRIF